MNVNLTLNHVKFINNDLKGEDIYDSVGGALSIINYENITINNCEFEKNYALDARAVLIEGIKSSKLTINNTNFTSNGKKDNEITNIGGALAIVAYHDNTNVEIDNCKFTNNTGNSSSALYYAGGEYYCPKLEIKNSIFKSNNNTGIYAINYYDEPYQAGINGTVTIATKGNVTITNTNFTENTGLMNAPLYYKNSNSSSQIIIKDSRFDLNVAEKHENNYWPTLWSCIFIPKWKINYIKFNIRK